MMRLTINVEDAAAKATLQAIAKAVEDREGLHASMATAVEKEVKDHLQVKYVPKNKRGDFWKRVHDSVEVQSDANGASVALVEIGIGLRYNGGDVFPGKNPAACGPRKGLPTAALAVPSDQVPVVNGRQLPPLRMQPLAFIRTVSNPETVGVLVEGMEKPVTRGKNKGKTRIVAKPGGALFFTLRSVTHHKEDKGILPEEAKLIAAAEAAAVDYVDSYEE